MKKTAFQMLAAAAAIVWISCNGNEQSTTTEKNDSMTVREDTTSKMVSDTARIEPNADTAVKAFVSEVASIGEMEIRLGNMASQKASGQRVKDFGGMMVNDHTAAGTELKGIARANAIAVPAELLPDQQHEYDMLKDKMGKDFDKAYMKMMVDGHKKVLIKFRAASRDLKNDAVRNFAAKTIPVLEKHFDSAQAILTAIK